MKGDIGASLRTLKDGDLTHTEPGLHAELGIAPFQFAPELLHRPWDFALVGLFEKSSLNTTWGVAAEAGPIFHVLGDTAKSTSTARLLPQAQLRLLVDPVSRKVGWGASVRATFEFASFTSLDTFGTSSSRGFLVGVAYGEIGVGAFVDMSYHSLDQLRGWTVTAGLSLRLPAAVGAICCVWR